MCPQSLSSLSWTERRSSFPQSQLSAPVRTPCPARKPAPRSRLESTLPRDARNVLQIQLGDEFQLHPRSLRNLRCLGRQRRRMKHTSRHRENNRKAALGGEAPQWTVLVRANHCSREKSVRTPSPEGEIDANRVPLDWCRGRQKLRKLLKNFCLQNGTEPAS